MKQFIKKTINRIILAGIVISLLPITLPAKAISTPTKISQQKIDVKITDIKKINTEKTFSESEIDQIIATIEKTIKSLNIIKYIATGTTIGVGVLTVIGSLVIPIIIRPLHRLAYIRVDTTKLTRKETTLIIGVITAIISGTVTAGTTLALFVGLSASSILAAFIGAEQLKTIEKNNPNALTKSQKIALEKFKSITKGPILKGLVKGLKLKNMYKTQAKKALKENPELEKSFKTKKKAIKTISYYIKNKMKAANLKINVDAFKKKIKQQIIKKNKYNKWSPKYHLENSKLITMKLDLKLALTKKYLKDAKNKIKKLNKLYPEMKLLKDIIEESMEQLKIIMI